MSKRGRGHVTKYPIHRLSEPVTFCRAVREPDLATGFSETITPYLPAWADVVEGDFSMLHLANADGDATHMFVVRHDPTLSIEVRDCVVHSGLVYRVIASRITRDKAFPRRMFLRVYTYYDDSLSSDRIVAFKDNSVNDNRLPSPPSDPHMALSEVEGAWVAVDSGGDDEFALTEDGPILVALEADTRVAGGNGVFLFSGDAVEVSL